MLITISLHDEAKKKKALEQEELKKEFKESLLRELRIRQKLLKKVTGSKLPQRKK
jgi:hypothetical protein